MLSEKEYLANWKTKTLFRTYVYLLIHFISKLVHRNLTITYENALYTVHQLIYPHNHFIIL